jgi:homoserine dehydrogenase
MTTTNVALLGFGNVGRAFVRLLAEKRASLAGRDGLDLRLKAVLCARGGILAGEGEDVPDLAGADREGLAGHPRFERGLNPGAVLRRLKPGVFAECISSPPETGEPALGHLREALSRGWHAVTADKGPLAADAGGLREAARAAGTGFRFSAATGAALPAADIALFSLAGAEIESIQGILNGTTNFVLTRMGRGESYEEALAAARRLGIAEPDPTRDVEGLDAAVKLLILSNLVFGESRQIGDVRVRGLSAATADEARRAAAAGRKIKLLASAVRRGGRTELSVEPAVLDAGHPLFGVDGAEKGVTFFTDTMGAVTVSGGKSDPRGAAAAMLKDIILLLGSRRP